MSEEERTEGTVRSMAAAGRRRKKDKNKDGDKPFNPYQETYDWLHCIIVAMIVCVLLFVMVARVIDVVGHSMEPTLQGGDKIIITRLAGDYEQGDIVVLRKDQFRAEPIVKRIIAMEGQTITIDFMAGTVAVDGQVLDEPYIMERAYDSLSMLDPAYYDVYGIDPETDVDGAAVTVTVPEGCVFVMGDNRNNSSDSRDWRINFVDTRYIMGKAIFRIFPFSKLGAIYGTGGLDG